MARPGDSFARVRPHALEQPAGPRGEGDLLRARERRRPGLRAVVPVWGPVRGGHESRGGRRDLAGLPSGVTCSLGSKHARVGEGVERRGDSNIVYRLDRFLANNPGL